MENIKSYCSTLDVYANLLDTIFKFYPDGMVCKDVNFNYINCNNAYCRLFSIGNTSELLNLNYNKFLSNNNNKLIYDACCEIRNNLYPLNYILNTQNNQILSITSSPIVKNSEFIGIISCVKDITQEENIKENFVNKHFNHLNAERRLQEQRETFVASVSHDLKNPTIAQIRGLELLLKGSFGEIKKEQSEMLTMILDSCRYMNGMLSSLLSTYRNYGGAVKLNFTEFAFKELVSECVSEMVYVARDKNIKIDCTPMEDIFICADRVQIKRVIMNLLSNAIKYSYKNTDIKLTAFNSSDGMCFESENNSPYIQEEKQKSIFARYVSYAGAHKELGNGLGLYASKKIIESHGGRIYVKSFKNDKNIFGFTIPVKQENKCAKEVFL